MPLALPFPGSSEVVESSEADVETSDGSSVFSCCVGAVGVRVRGVFFDVRVLHEIHTSFVVRCVRPQCFGYTSASSRVAYLVSSRIAT